MQEMARVSRLTPDRTAYRRGNLNHGDITQGHRVTYIDRPNPQLPFEDEGDTLYAAWQEAVKRTFARSTKVHPFVDRQAYLQQPETLYAAWQEAVKRTVDAIFEQEAQ